MPAPIFRFTADIQSRRRLGLTATLVREDGMEGEVFSLIGPKRFDVPWKEIEAQGYIAPADCVEVRITLTDAERLNYATAEQEDRYRFCSTSQTKKDVAVAVVLPSYTLSETVAVIVKLFTVILAVPEAVALVSV